MTTSFEAFLTEHPDTLMTRQTWERNEVVNEREAAIELSLEAAHHLHSALRLLDEVASLTRVDLFGASLNEAMEQLTEIAAMLDEAGQN